MTNVKPATNPLTGMDAQEWAKEFMRIWAGRWAEVDEALMISWFANAIMRGFDEGRRRTDADKDTEIARLRAIESRGICLEQAAEIASLKADQADWRKGVGFIAAALGIDSLSCVDIAERGLEIRAERDALKAEVERLTPAVLPCRACGSKGFSDIVHGSVVLCDTCHGTGRAR